MWSDSAIDLQQPRHQVIYRILYSIWSWQRFSFLFLLLGRPPSSSADWAIPAASTYTPPSAWHSWSPWLWGRWWRRGSLCPAATRASWRTRPPSGSRCVVLSVRRKPGGKSGSASQPNLASQSKLCDVYMQAFSCTFWDRSASWRPPPHQRPPWSTVPGPSVDMETIVHQAKRRNCCLPPNLVFQLTGGAHPSCQRDTALDGEDEGNRHKGRLATT